MFLEILQNSQENTCARVSFFNKGLRPETLFKKILWYKCFPVNFAKVLGTPFPQNTYGRLLLKIKLFIHNSEKTNLLSLSYSNLLSNCWIWNTRSSRSEVFCKKDVPKNFTKFAVKHLCQSLFFNKVARP